ncbi:DAF factor, partial [Jacana jacana]|nr:DAF factor [Jacana jacana]
CSSPVITFFSLLVVLQCPSPPNIKNGQHESTDMNVFIPGMSVKYYCDPGYFLTGKTTVSCLTSGSWSTPYPRCEVLQCPSPPAIDHGNHSSQGLEVFPPGMVVNYSCDPGYSLLGEAAIHCTDSGNWSLPPPRCAGTP